MLFYHNRIPYHLPGADPTPGPTSFSNFAFWRDDSFASVSFALSNEGPSISLSASRTTGVAPLAVFFDASATVDASTSLPFHELGYSWNFNDPGSGNWWDGFSKNVAYGPVAAHVFEDPGTYNVTLTVTNGTQETSETVQIVADDPDSTYSGTNTIAIGQLTLPVAGVDGVPSGASCVQESDWPTIVNTHYTTGKRILLKHDDTFTGTATALLNKGTDSTGSIIGMYGTGAKPIIRTTGTANHSNLLNLSTTGALCDNLRLMDLDFDGQSDVHRNFIYAPGTNYLLTNLLLLRVDAHDLGGGIGLTVGAASATPDQIFVVDSTVRRISTDAGTGHREGIFIEGKRLGILGTEVDDTIGNLAEHLFRFQYCGRGVFSHNLLKNSASGKEMFALRAPQSDGSGPAAFGTGEDAATKYVVISHNQIETNDYMGIQVDPGASFPTGLLHDVIIEDNWFPTKTGGASCIRIRANNITIRNNISDQSLAPSGPVIDVLGDGASGVAGAFDVWVYNNSVYSGGTQNTIFLQILLADVTGLVIRNTLLYEPNFAGTPVNVLDSGTGSSYTESNNLVTKTTNPLFVVSPPLVPANFALGTGSPCIDAGFAVPVFYDYLDATRTSGAAMDQGAIES